MPILPWNDEYSLGVEAMDDHHRQLFEMINQAYDSADRMSDHEVLSRLVDGMNEFAQVHFELEEGLMEEHGYPKLDEHRRQHQDFRMRAMITKTMQPGEDWELNAVKIFRYLADWLNDHILETDTELARFLNEKGIS